MFSKCFWTVFPPVINKIRRIVYKETWPYKSQKLWAHANSHSHSESADHEKLAVRTAQGVALLCVLVQQSALTEEQMKSV